MLACTGRLRPWQPPGPTQRQGGCSILAQPFDGAGEPSFAQPLQASARVVPPPRRARHGSIRVVYVARLRAVSRSTLAILLPFLLRKGLLSPDRAGTWKALGRLVAALQGAATSMGEWALSPPPLPWPPSRGTPDTSSMGKCSGSAFGVGRTRPGYGGSAAWVAHTHSDAPAR